MNFIQNGQFKLKKIKYILQKLLLLQKIMEMYTSKKFKYFTTAHFQIVYLYIYMYPLLIQIPLSEKTKLHYCYTLSSISTDYIALLTSVLKIQLIETKKKRTHT